MVLSLIANGLLLAIVVLLSNVYRSPGKRGNGFARPPVQSLISQNALRHQLTYEEWVELLAQEARVTAKRSPKHLAVLAGDSLSLWFPVDLLPPGQLWLNQGISGETSMGLLRRLSLLDKTRPEKIFILVGINDLLRGVEDETVLKNHQRIIRYLRRVHPRSQIVVQSILPHQGTKAKWQGRDRLAQVSNDRIRTLNRNLANLATQERVDFLDLHPLFTDNQGNLRPDFTTDGLHLNAQGYLVWRTAIQLFNQLKSS